MMAQLCKLVNSGESKVIPTQYLNVKISPYQAILEDLILHTHCISLTFTESVLVLDRIYYEISLQASKRQADPQYVSRKPIAGIVPGPYLAFITKKDRLVTLQV